ncbi:MAG: hypothetical protein RL536_124 [Candidatus Parcubacteria bacterium]
MKIYIGCPIQGFNNKEWQKHWSELETLKNSLRKIGHEILDFKSNEKKQAEPGTVFKWDHEQCMNCDAMIAIALGPSTGMGMEIGMCLKRTRGQDNSPSPAFVFATAPHSTNVSRMITECNLPNFVFERCDSFTEIPEKFEKAYKESVRNTHK